MGDSLPTAGRCVRLLMASLDRGECYVFAKHPHLSGVHGCPCTCHTPVWVEKIINNNNDKQGPCLAPMGSGLNAREAIACLSLGQRGWGGGRTLVKATQLGSGATCRLACTCLPNSYLTPGLYIARRVFIATSIYGQSRSRPPSLPLTQFIFP